MAPRDTAEGHYTHVFEVFVTSLPSEVPDKGMSRHSDVVYISSFLLNVILFFELL